MTAEIIPGLRPLKEIAAELNFSRTALANACTRRVLQHVKTGGILFTTKEWAEEYINGRHLNMNQHGVKHLAGLPRQKVERVAATEAKPSTNNRERTQSEVQAQFEYERRLREKAMRLHLALAAKGLPVRLPKPEAADGIEVLPMPRYYFAAGKSYVGFSVR